MSTETPLLQLEGASKSFGIVKAITDVDVTVNAGEVTCILGDNGAGKSTLIKMLAGVHPPDSGRYLVEGEPVTFGSPRDALSRGIATVYQDLALVPMMPIWRNFFLGTEPVRRFGPFKFIRKRHAQKIAVEELGKMGIMVRDPEQAVSTLSGGERQSVAIARAVYFGARTLILDEPTAALGVKQAGVVLHYIVEAKKRGVGVVFITHNPHHAYPVGDHFVVLRRGEVLADRRKEDIELDELIGLMAGGEDLASLQHELRAAQDEA